MKYLLTLTFFLAALTSTQTLNATQINCQGKINECRFSDPDDGCLCPATKTSQNTRASKTLDGIYDVELTVGDKVFHDVLEMHGKDGTSIPIKFGRTEVEGTMTVPGVFVAPIKGSITFRITWPGTFASIQFDLVAVEGGQPYNVYYTGSVGGNKTNTIDDLIEGTSPAVIKGTASVDGENGTKTPIGSFKAVQRDQ